MKLPHQEKVELEQIPPLAETKILKESRVLNFLNSIIYLFVVIFFNIFFKFLLSSDNAIIGNFLNLFRALK